MDKKINEKVNRNFDLFFIKSEQEAKKIQKNIMEIIYLFDNNEKNIKKALAEGVGNGVEFFDDTYIIDLISFIYSKEYADRKDSIIKMVESFPYVKGVKKYGELIKFETFDGTIECTPISSMISYFNDRKDGSKRSRALENLCTVVKSIKKRNNNCHYLSVKGTELFSQKLNIKSNVVTGYPKYYVPDNRYLHSWIEMKVDGKFYALDFTKNIIIDRKSYYRLLHIDNNEICSVISSDNIIEDKKNYGEFIKILDLKTYLTSRDELIKDLSKNRSHFNNSDIDCVKAR